MAHTLQQIDYSVLQQCMHCGMCLTCSSFRGQTRGCRRGWRALFRGHRAGPATSTSSRAISYPRLKLDVPMQLAEFAKGSDVLVFATFAMVERELEAGTIAVVRAPALDMRASYGFIYLKHRSLSPGTRAYMQFVRDQESVIVEREARLERLYA